MDIKNNNGKLYDLTSIYAISEHSPEFLSKLILVFCDNIKNDIILINDAAKDAKWSEVSQHVHKMKPSLAHFGVDSAKDIIIELEHPGNRDSQYLNSLVTELNRITTQLLLELKAEFPDIL